MRLRDDNREALLASIKRFVFEEFEQDIGDLKAANMLDFFLEEIGPAVYNQAIADAQILVEQKLGDLSGELYEPELRYWKRNSAGRPPQA